MSRNALYDETPTRSWFTIRESTKRWIEAKSQKEGILPSELVDSCAARVESNETDLAIVEAHLRGKVDLKRIEKEHKRLLAQLARDNRRLAFYRSQIGGGHEGPRLSRDLAAIKRRQLVVQTKLAELDEELKAYRRVVA